MTTLRIPFGMAVAWSAVMAFGMGDAVRADENALIERLRSCKGLESDSARLTCLDDILAGLPAAPASSRSTPAAPDASSAASDDTAPLEMTPPFAMFDRIPDEPEPEPEDEIEPVREAATATDTPSAPEPSAAPTGADHSASRTSERKTDPAPRKRAPAQPTELPAPIADDAPVMVFNGRVPESIPSLFGASDLPEERAAVLFQSINVNEALRRPELETLRATIAKSGTTRSGKPYVYLDNGQVWRWTDPARVFFGKAGEEQVEIVRGALGSFRIQIGGAGQFYRVERLK